MIDSRLSRGSFPLGRWFTNGQEKECLQYSKTLSTRAPCFLAANSLPTDKLMPVLVVYLRVFILYIQYYNPFANSMCRYCYLQYPNPSPVRMELAFLLVWIVLQRYSKTTRGSRAGVHNLSTFDHFHEYLNTQERKREWRKDEGD